MLLRNITRSVLAVVAVIAAASVVSSPAQAAQVNASSLRPILQPSAGPWDTYSYLVRDTNGLMVEFRRRDDSAVWHRWETCSGCGYTDWVSLGNRRILGSPAATVTSAGVLVVFAVDLASQGLIHKWQVCNGCGWTDWSPLGGILTSNPDVVMKSNNVMVAFGRGTDNSIYHIWQTSPHGNWSNWSSLGQPEFPFTTYPVAGRFADDSLTVSAGDGFYIWTRNQNSNGGSWGPWH